MATQKRQLDSFIAALVATGTDENEELQFDEVKYAVGSLPPVESMRQEVWEHIKERAEKEWGDRLITLMWESDLKILGHKPPREDEKYWDPESEEEPDEEEENEDSPTTKKLRPSSRRSLEEMMGGKRRGNGED